MLSNENIAPLEKIFTISKFEGLKKEFCLKFNPKPKQTVFCYRKKVKLRVLNSKILRTKFFELLEEAFKEKKRKVAHSSTRKVDKRLATFRLQN